MPPLKRSEHRILLVQFALRVIELLSDKLRSLLGLPLVQLKVLSYEQ